MPKVLICTGTAPSRRWRSCRAIAQEMSPQVTPQSHVDVGAAAELDSISLSPRTGNVTVTGGRPRLSSPRPVDLVDERAIADLPLMVADLRSRCRPPESKSSRPHLRHQRRSSSAAFAHLQLFVDGGDFRTPSSPRREASIVPALLSTKRRQESSGSTTNDGRRTRTGAVLSSTSSPTRFDHGTDSGLIIFLRQWIGAAGCL